MRPSLRHANARGVRQQLDCPLRDALPQCARATRSAACVRACVRIAFPKRRCWRMEASWSGAGVVAAIVATRGGPEGTRRVRGEVLCGDEGQVRAEPAGAQPGGAVQWAVRWASAAISTAQRQFGSRCVCLFVCLFVRLFVCLLAQLVQLFGLSDIQQFTDEDFRQQSEPCRCPNPLSTKSRPVAPCPTLPSTGACSSLAPPAASAAAERQLLMRAQQTTKAGPCAGISAGC